MWIKKSEYEKLINAKSSLIEDCRKKVDDLTEGLLRKNAMCQRLNSWCMNETTKNIELESKIKELEAQLAEQKQSETKLPFVVIHCTDEPRFSDYVIDYVNNKHKESNKEQPKEKEVEVKPYYFERLPYPKEFVVTEICDLMDNDINIGSLTCRQCKHCIVNNGDGFIKCKLKPEGKAKKQAERFKRDEYGVISKTDGLKTCSICTYKNEDGNSEVCKHCKKYLKDSEYYSSK